MTRISLRIDDAQTREAFRRMPGVMAEYVDGGLARGANEIAIEARRLAPKSLSGLVNSINAARSGELEYSVSPGVAYAPWVESGTGPAAGQEKYYPNPDNLLAYLMISPKARGFSRWSRSEKGRTLQEMVLVRRAQAFAWWIYQHGTKAQPFMAPAAEAKRDACLDYVRAAVNAGLKEVLGGHA